jgi:hypothetical protein
MWHRVYIVKIIVGGSTMIRLLIGLGVLVCIVLAIREFLRARSVVAKKSELEAVALETELLHTEEQIAQQRLHNSALQEQTKNMNSNGDTE